jgi:hypothetical protein
MEHIYSISNGQSEYLGLMELKAVLLEPDHKLLKSGPSLETMRDSVFFCKYETFYSYKLPMT